MFLLRFIALIVFFSAFFVQCAFCAVDYKIKDLIIDNSDRVILIKGQGSYKSPQSSVYVPVPDIQKAKSSLNLINDITTFTLTNPYRFVVDIPNAKLQTPSRTYKINNSSVLKDITISQFSANPNVVRAVFSVNKQEDLSKFKVYSNTEDIFVKYGNQIIDNSIQYKFFTPSGDQDKTATPQNTSAVIYNNNNNEKKEFIPSLQNKYFLSQINQNSDGLLLKGIGAISLIKPTYSSDNTKAVLYIDCATLSPKFENKIFAVPSSKEKNNVSLTLSTYNSKRIKLELSGKNLRDYRFVLSSDGQSLFISHRSYILNNNIAQNPSKISSYKFSKNANGYYIFDISFLEGVVYSTFELNGNFYLDIYNLSDYNQQAFNNALKNSNIKIQASKISSDKTRYIIPLSELNFSYANVESNAKSIKLCFKEKPKTEENIIVQTPKQEQNPQIASKNDNSIILPSVSKNVNPAPVPSKGDVINVSPPTKIEPDMTSITYVPKGETQEPSKSQKKKSQISTMKKVVIDPGHGGADCGAIGGGVQEKNINLAVALLVEEKLKKKDIYTYMTRSKDTTLTLEDRTNYSNEINPDIYVSIHTNSTLQSDIYGLEVHYYKDDSIRLASSMHENFASAKNLKKWQTKDRGVIKSRFYVINHTEAPSVLIEIGFLSNETERAKLIKKERQEEIADAIVKGILQYLGIK